MAYGDRVNLLLPIAVAVAAAAAYDYRRRNRPAAPNSLPVFLQIESVPEFTGDALALAACYRDLGLQVQIKVESALTPELNALTDRFLRASILNGIADVHIDIADHSHAGRSGAQFHARARTTDRSIAIKLAHALELPELRKQLTASQGQLLSAHSRFGMFNLTVFWPQG